MSDDQPAPRELVVGPEEPRRQDYPPPPQRWADRIVSSGMAAPDSFLANPHNFRLHSGVQEEALEEVLDRVGWVRRVLVNRTTGHVLDGHLRVALAIRRNEPEIPYDEVEISEADEKLVLAALDPIAGMAGTDHEQLAALTAELDLNLDGSLKHMLDELEKFSARSAPKREGETNPDDVPEERVTTDIVLGDLFRLGDHYLLCGDSTSPCDVARVMDGARAVLVNTDPPYGIAYDSAAMHDNNTNYEPIAQDDLTDGPALQAFLESVIRAALPHLSDAPAFYLWHPMLTQGTFFAAAAAAAADILIHRQIIWLKPQLVFGRGDYHWQHELAFYGWIRGRRCPFLGPRNQTTRWEVGYGESRNERFHPTQKPVELFRRPIDNHCSPGDVIYEPFAGSGAQIIAAEERLVSCRAIEMNPVYVQQIIDRWQAFTGREAVKIGEAADGQPEPAAT